jgi:hypothetical protein
LPYKSGPGQHTEVNSIKPTVIMRVSLFPPIKLLSRPTHRCYTASYSFPFPFLDEAARKQRNGQNKEKQERRTRRKIKTQNILQTE